MSALLLRLIPFKAEILGGIAALLLGCCLWLQVDLRLTEHQLSETAKLLEAVRAARALEQSQAKDAAIRASADFRALEQQYQRQKDEAALALKHDQESNARVIASLSKQLVGVRGELAAFASGSREPSGDSLEACQRRARSLGDVLGEALRLQDELAGDAEAEAANARSVLAAWPVK